MRRVLRVWWDGKPVGQLTQDRYGDLGFAYSESWLRDESGQPLSASLPKREEPFSRRECRPFFAGLLPEDSQRNAAAQALGVSSGNDFALLEGLGGDVAGALQLLPPGEPPGDSDFDSQPSPLDEAELIGVLDALPTRPLLAGTEGLRLSLAGAQSKLPVVLVDGDIALPLSGQPTTHILKPPVARFPGTTENEAFVMRLAADIGLDVARVEPRLIGNRPFLLVERYDRSVGADRRTRRIHQEDFCQALSVPPELKYAEEGGPTLEDCFRLLRSHSIHPALDILKLLDAVIFNLIVGNADAHGKNFSILYRRSEPRLAPLYDLLSTVAWPELSPGFAMTIGKRATLAELDAEGWAAFASGAVLGLPFVRRRVADISQTIKTRAERVACTLKYPGLDAGILSRMAKRIADRAERCVHTIRE